jgi:hypothetical protein
MTNKNKAQHLTVGHTDYVLVLGDEKFIATTLDRMSTRQPQFTRQYEALKANFEGKFPIHWGLQTCAARRGS